jgi:hypothetical protein
MKHAIAGGALVVTLLAPASLAAAAGAGATPTTASCATHWGEKAKHAGSMVRSRVSSVRAGQHACFDRLVIGLGKGKRPGYRVRYVKKIVSDGSGQTIPVRGKGKLQISILAPASNGFPANGHHLANVKGFRTFRQVVGAGSFEGITTVGLGVRKKLPFRVLILSGPGHGWRLVIDVAHS